jgi:hypothetical protein
MSDHITLLALQYIGRFFSQDRTIRRFQFFWIPKGANRFHFVGGSRFVHGGIMPQEIVVPVLTVKHSLTASVCIKSNFWMLLTIFSVDLVEMTSTLRLVRCPAFSPICD